MRPLPEIRDDTSHLAALMRLESTGDSLAQVVGPRGEKVGIVTLERLASRCSDLWFGREP